MSRASPAGASTNPTSTPSLRYLSQSIQSETELTELPRGRRPDSQHFGLADEFDLKLQEVNEYQDLDFSNKVRFEVTKKGEFSCPIARALGEELLKVLNMPEGRVEQLTLLRNVIRSIQRGKYTSVRDFPLINIPDFNDHLFFKIIDHFSKFEVSRIWSETPSITNIDKYIDTMCIGIKSANDVIFNALRKQKDEDIILRVMQEAFTDGAEIDAVSRGRTDYESFVHLAAKNSQCQVLEFLTDKKAKLNARYFNKQKALLSPLLLAIDSNSADAVEILLSNGANPNTSALDATALSKACRNQAILRLLLQYNVQIDFRHPITKETALMHAAKSDNVFPDSDFHKSVLILLEAGADYTLTRTDGHTAYSLASPRCQGVIDRFMKAQGNILKEKGRILKLLAIEILSMIKAGLQVDSSQALIQMAIDKITDKDVAQSEDHKLHLDSELICETGKLIQAKLELLPNLEGLSADIFMEIAGEIFEELPSPLYPRNVKSR